MTNYEYYIYIYADSNQQTRQRKAEVCFGNVVLSMLVLAMCVFFVICIVRVAEAAGRLFDPPDRLKMEVTDASLTLFNSTTTSNNSYYLSLNITLRNPNQYFHIYYDSPLVVVDFHNQTSAMASVADFHQPERNTTLLTPSLKLQHAAGSGSGSGSGSGGYYYDIVVKLYFPKTYKSISRWRTDWPSNLPLYTCDLKVPLKNGSQSATSAFNTTKCMPVCQCD